MKNVLSFFGSDHKVGVTQLAQCCAEYLAVSYPMLSVLLIFGDGGQGSDYCLKVNESLENIRPFIVQEIVKTEELKSRSRYKDNLYIIGGREAPETGDYFTPDMAELFINAIRSSFDLIIIDSGCDISEYLSIGLLFASDRIYHVINQKESSLRRTEWYTELYDKLDLNIERHILNKYEKYSLYEQDYISERLNLDKRKMFTVVNSKLGEKAESENKSIISLNPSRTFKKDIAKICRDIIEYAEIRI